MFCKWCGGSLTPSDTKCKRCGKEVATLSDCGGFYDLVPNAKKHAEIYHGDIVTPAKIVKRFHKIEDPKKQDLQKIKSNNRKALFDLTTLTVIGFIVVILMLLTTLIKVNQYSSGINALLDNQWTIIEEVNVIAKAIKLMASESEPTAEPVAVLEPILAEQDVSFTVGITSGDSGQEIAPDLSLGDYTDTAIVTYGLDRQTGFVNSVGCALKEADTTVLLTISTECNNKLQILNVSVSYVVDEIVFGSPEAPETCKWQYRFSDEAAWNDLNDLPDTYIHSNGYGKTELCIRETAWQELIAESEGKIEMRCEISRTNTENGSLTIVVYGIKFY